ncbi:MAG TPA: transglutaminase-like domain-containing protein [Phycisphaerae bacterium]|nr:transglutaminase-like domain-containing protein [Phycisphaerae bacterium]
MLSRFLSRGLSPRRLMILLPLSLMLLPGGCATWPADVEMSLAKAGENRAELELVMRHYKRLGDPQKLEAAQFLIRNMDGHGYILTAFYDKDGNEVEFEALDYPNFKEAQAALDVLEKEHGELDYDTKRFDADLETVSAEYLIENIDLAFRAWREKPWAQDLTFEALCEYVLGYRGDNEPVNSFRPTCLARYADLPAKMEDPTDVYEAADLVRKDVNAWVPFNELYYLHPTDQSFEEMNQRRLGRCGDISNMMMYAMRSVAIPAAVDFTPWWADRDNNHAWEVILDAQGRGKARLLSRAAKIYRKTFAIQRDSLACRAGKDAKLPRYLNSRNYKDATDQYVETTDVTVRLENDRPAGTRFAYICVFNGGKWRPIHWGEIDGDRVTFTKLGRHIAYLPAYCVDEEPVPAAPPFILTREGDVRTLVGRPNRKLTIELTVTKPETPDADTQITKPMIVVEPGKTYELFVWRDGWQSLGKQTAGDEPVSFDNVPAGGLYWLVAEGSRRLERIFTIEEGKQVWW